MWGPASPYQLKFYMFLSYPLFTFYTDFNGSFNVFRRCVHILSLSIEELILWLSFEPFPSPVNPIYNAGCPFSGRPLTRDDWKYWWPIGRHFNGRPPGE